MKRIFYILVTIFLLLGSAIYSQDPMNNLLQEVRAIANRDISGGLSYEEIEGSPYDSDKFIQGTVLLKNGKSTNVPLRYNLFTDEFEFMQEGKVFSLIKNSVQSIQRGGEAIYPENLKYYFSQESGKYSLYIRKKVSFVPKVPARPYIDEIPPTFKREMDEYYLKEENMPAREIKNKKGLLEMLGDNKAAIDFIKKSKTKVNKVEDLLELVKFLNAQ